MTKKVLIAAVHPDDETLGCGGTILKHLNNGDEVYWLIITNVLEEFGWNKAIVDRRQQEIEAVAALYGFTGVVKLDLPTMKLDEIPTGTLVDNISATIRQIQPEIVYLPNRSDVHSDHRVAFDALYSCTKNFRYPYIKKILMYETLSETEFAPALSECSFVPNTFVDITDYFNKKIELMKIFESEVMQGNLPRSLSAIEALAKVRGSRVGCCYAESFCLLMSIC